jgi:hypothetical protein
MMQDIGTGLIGIPIQNSIASSSCSECTIERVWHPHVIGCPISMMYICTVVDSLIGMSPSCLSERRQSRAVILL